jgi:AbrB family looped-hinge helix DNA binding protein
MTSVKLSSKHQIVIPREARERLGLRPGDRLDVRLESERIVLEKSPGDVSRALKGLLSGSFGDDAESYLAEERRAWGRDDSEA